MNLKSDIRELKGVGDKTAALLRRLGIETVEDLIHYYPRDYESFEEPVKIADIREEGVFTVDVTVCAEPVLRRVGHLQILTVSVKDESGGLSLTWFRMPYLKKALYPGKSAVFRGKVRLKGSRFVMDQPRIFHEDQYAKVRDTLQPQYVLTKGVTSKGIAGAVRQALDKVSLDDYLDEKTRSSLGLMDMARAVRIIHFPGKREELLEARRRLVFDEFFLFILAVRRLRDRAHLKRQDFHMVEVAESERLIEGLPYRLTNAQMRVWEEVKRDMQGEFVMNRLVQGDVGSGKTVIAVLALVMAACNGYQGALMVPTEVLARQHLSSMKELFQKHAVPVRPILLTGSMSAREKREVYGQIESGEAQIVIGTHALIQEKVLYKDLALVVTDEQHRFGVRQRETLSQKGSDPHVLVMSATPIPRSLAIILYGDLDISVINELPAKRLPLKNCVVDTGYRQTAYRFIEKEIRAGRQAMIICPMVEESESIDAENVVDYARSMGQVFPPDIRVGCLHGRMKSADKNRIMEEFSQNRIQLLVSTTVIEVGVNVPNATVMMIENAERFGLAQLHQLRGRVGRGEYQSYCIFVSGSKRREAMDRLEILNKSCDGFYIAGEDMKLRGPGDLFGFRQSGMMDFKIGDIFTDAAILKAAGETADNVLEEDPSLRGHLGIRDRLLRQSKDGAETISL